MYIYIISMHDREMTHILLITVQYTVKWYRPETVNIPNISCIILEYTILKYFHNKILELSKYSNFIIERLQNMLL